ncbi:protein dispatched homolog 1-like [Watersipora subatra]|uniref:protein dispatched homolog 1-like n=1 Tax=Watersipora subatra TaxID=2589382 RepID=UPI00355B32B5
MAHSRYSEILTHYPGAVLAIVLVLVSCSTILNILVAPPPDFSDPLQGFIPRYSVIHSAYAAWSNLIDETAVGAESNKLLTTYPQSNTLQRGDNSTTWAGSTFLAAFTKQEATYDLWPTSTYGYAGDNVTRSSRRTAKESYFCDSQPRRGYAQVALKLGCTLAQLDIHTFVSLCNLQKELESSPLYAPICEPSCLCRSFSLVNYVSYLAGRDSCDRVSESDLKGNLQILLECKHYVEDLPADCWSENFVRSDRCNMSSMCADRSIYEIFYYIMSKSTDLTITYVHIAKSSSNHPFYLKIRQLMRRQQKEPVQVLAVDFGLKEYVFEKLLFKDSLWIFSALLLIIVILLFYTRSIFITSITFISMAFSIVISFSIYGFVFQIGYFPFLNLLAAVVVVALGADDLFVYWKTWTTIKLSRNASVLERIVTLTFQHASVAMFVTSASTAAAFYACSYTDIVSIRCFSVYAGTCVLVHYLLAVTWLPACVVLYEKYALNVCSNHRKCEMQSKGLQCLQNICTRITRMLSSRHTIISTWSRVWLPFFLLVSVASAVALFFWPGLSPPSSDMFQVLSANHPFEVFDLQVKPEFAVSADRGRLPIIFVFGVNPQFNGQYFKVSSTGALVLRPLPKLSAPKTQLWFSDFCYELRQQPFFDQSQHQPVGCFIEEMRASMRFRPCDIDPVCCKKLSFPYNESTFTHCLVRWSLQNRQIKVASSDPGIRYQGTTPSAIIISFQSSVKFDYSYQTMKEFHENVTRFLGERLAECLQSDCEAFTPFFTTAGGLLFYDVQQVLVHSLPTTVIVIIVTAAVIIFLTTLNILLTFCALVSISSSILCTLASLALMGWQLNILESVIVSLAVGLSMDFPLHVTVAYKISSSTRDRQRRVTVSLQHIRGCITAAMVTTLAAGLCVLPAQVLAYCKLGIFLALVSVTSWFHALFFLPSLLMHIGPIGSFLQINPRCCRLKTTRSTGLTRPMDKTIYSDDLSTELTRVLPSNASSSPQEPITGELEVEVNDQNLLTPPPILLQPGPMIVPRWGRLSPITELPSVSPASGRSSVESL